jgi:hypothetical protein
LQAAGGSPRNSTGTDVEKEEKTLIPRVSGAGGCNRSDRIEAGDKDYTKTTNTTATCANIMDMTEINENMGINIE